VSPARCASAIVALLLPAVAAAHTVLVDSAVPLDATILKAKTETHATLRFSAALQARGSGVELVPEHAEARPLAVVFGPGPAELSATIPALEPGVYALRYHVIAGDGHVTEGSVTVRVAAP
jgi:methionine-rich copper-binding protein CopC